MAGNIVEVENLAFLYGDLEVFRGLSLAIPEGKVVGVLGGSGSGKSTLLKLIGGQLAPSRGTVKVAGKNVHELDSRELYALRLEMGMMFQTSGLFSDLSVYDNVAFPIAENFKLPEVMLRRLVAMKLQAVVLRGAREMQSTCKDRVGPDSDGYSRWPRVRPPASGGCGRNRDLLARNEMPCGPAVRGRSNAQAIGCHWSRGPVECLVNKAA